MGAVNPTGRGKKTIGFTWSSETVVICNSHVYPDMIGFPVLKYTVCQTW